MKQLDRGPRRGNCIDRILTPRGDHNGLWFAGSGDHKACTVYDDGLGVAGWCDQVCRGYSKRLLIGVIHIRQPLLRSGVCMYCMLSIPILELVRRRRERNNSGSGIPSSGLDTVPEKNTRRTEQTYGAPLLGFGIVVPTRPSPHRNQPDGPICVRPRLNSVSMLPPPPSGNIEARYCSQPDGSILLVETHVMRRVRPPIPAASDRSAHAMAHSKSSRFSVSPNST